MQSKRRLNNASNRSQHNRERERNGIQLGYHSLWIIAFLLIMTGMVACQSTSTQTEQTPIMTSELPTEAPTVEQPEEATLDGNTILQESCSICHNTQRVKQVQNTKEDWEQTVTRMIEKGARLTEQEELVLLDYLAENYGP